MAALIIQTACAVIIVIGLAEGVREYVRIKRERRSESRRRP